MAARPALQQKGKTVLVIQKSQQKNRAGPLDMSFALHFLPARVRGVKFTFYILHVNLHFFTVK